MKLEYIKNGDYFLPEIALSEQAAKPLDKYGRLRRTYLQEHRRALFNHLILSEKLFPHLNEVDEQAQHLLDTMMPPLAKAAGVTELLKATEQMIWVGLSYFFLVAYPMCVFMIDTLSVVRYT